MSGASQIFRLASRPHTGLSLSRFSGAFEIFRHALLLHALLCVAVHRAACVSWMRFPKEIPRIPADPLQGDIRPGDCTEIKVELALSKK